MTFQTTWFLLIAVLWVGYFILEGFDFGVGMLLPFVSRNEADRRAVLTTLGPVWDGNEVWLLVAGGATFAAFPEWYATLFSGFYLPLFLILVSLIVRGVAFEYRGKGHTIGADEAKWKSRFDWMIVIGSALPALLWGVAFANIVQGVPLNKDHVYTGTLFTLLNPYGLLGGLVTLTLFFTHGLVFITLKTEGEIKDRARALATKVGIITTVLAAVFLVWTLIAHFSVLGFILTALAALSLIAALVNVVFGLLVAWVLVRYNFFGKKVVDALVDLPFALPTAVAGISLTALLAGNGWVGQYLEPLGIQLAFNPNGVVIALIFIGLPFVVRTVQPVLEDAEKELEEAATCLGATRWQTFSRVIFPSIAPALLTGFAMAFARAIGEYGSVIFIAGNMPMVSEITPLIIIGKLEQYDYAGATAVAVVMLVISFVLLLVINALQAWQRRHTGAPA